MRLFSSYTSALSRRSDDGPTVGTPPPDHDFWYSKLARFFGLGSSHVRADPDTVFGLPAVYACVRVLAHSAAQIPLIAYERVGENDRRRVSGRDFSRIIARPNRWQYHFKWVAMQIAHCALRGDCFSQIVRNRRGEIEQLVPLHPGRMTVDQGKRGYLIYILDADEKSKRVTFDQSEIFHCSALSSDGLRGLSPITVARRTFEQRLASREYRSKFYENSAQPSGILKMPGALKDEDAIKRLKKDWQEAHSGIRNAHKVAILEHGLEWQQIGLSAKDNDYVEEERLGLEDVARIFGIPPHKIGDLTRSTNNNIEHQSIEFVRDCLMPWLKNFEEALMFALLSEKDAERFYFEFLVDGLLRGDYKTRQEGLAIQRQNGIISANEWRRIENINALPSDVGDALLVNGNMVPVALAGAAVKMQLDAAAAVEEEDDEPAEDDDSEDQRSALRQVYREAFAELIGRTERKWDKWHESNAEKADFSEKRGVFVQNHRVFMSETLRSSAKTYLFALNLTQKTASRRSNSELETEVDRLLGHFIGSVISDERPESLDSRADRMARRLASMLEGAIASV